MSRMFESLDLMLPQETFDAPMHMALDEVLLKNVVTPLVRFYSWGGECVTFGYFQKYEEVKKMYQELPLTRRWSGGGIVKHGEDLTFSLVIPNGARAAKLPPALFYKELHSLIAEKLVKSLSVDIRLTKKEDIRLGADCFQAPAGDDLLMRGRKILGGAQRRSAGALLYQGSLQLKEGAVSPEMLAGAIGTRISPIALSDEVRKLAFDLALNRYAAPSWNERR